MLGKKGILRRHHGADTLEEGTFLDLGSMGFDEDANLAGAKAVRLAEVIRFDDIHQVSKLAYQGDMVIIDVTSVSNDPNTMRRLGVDLKNVAKDINGDVAGIAKNLICLTPSGFRIDRQKIRSSL